MLSLLAFPLAFIALATKRFGFRVLYVLGASVCGELLALFLLTSYNKWEGSKLIVGESPEVVAHLAKTSDLRVLGASLLLASTLGLVIGLLVVFVHWVYIRAQSA